MIEHCRVALKAELKAEFKAEDAHLSFKYEELNKRYAQLPDVQGLMAQFGELRGTYGRVKEELGSMLEELHGRLGKEDSDGWGEAVAKLREDCKEAMQREMRARKERDKSLQDWMEHEIEIHAQATKKLETSLAEIRESLESHTHELHIDGKDV